VRGNLRTNAAGRNLNREWRAPDPAASPEVFAVRAEMERTGCALFLDIHGDEALPYVFFSTAEEVPGFSAAMAAAQARFVEAFAAASPDFQTLEGYRPGRFGDELLSLASKWVAHRFGCVSLTLEMPFKDNALLPDGEVGWDGARSKRLGAAMLGPIRAPPGPARSGAAGRGGRRSWMTAISSLLVQPHGVRRSRRAAARFEKMLGRGNPPGDWNALIAASQQDWV